jgi:hypothetical protein
MRTTFGEMRLFNYNFFRARDIFYIQQKEVGSKRERGRERKRKRRMRCIGEKGCGVDHKLDCWSSIYKGLYTDFIKMNIKLFLRI